MSSATHEMQVMPTKTLFHYAPQPNCRFNADANTGHGFAIFMASVGALPGRGNTQQPSPRPSGVMRYQRSTSTT